MTDLICTLDMEDAKSKLNHVQKLIEEGEWDQIFIISYGNADVKTGKSTTDIVLNSADHLPVLIEKISSSLRGKTLGFEVAINLISGDGKLHMALLSALLKLGLALRFVALTTQGLKEV